MTKKNRSKSFLGGGYLERWITSLQGSSSTQKRMHEVVVKQFAFFLTPGEKSWVSLRIANKQKTKVDSTSQPKGGKMLCSHRLNCKKASIIVMIWSNWRFFPIVGILLLSQRSLGVVLSVASLTANGNDVLNYIRLDLVWRIHNV